MIRRGFQGSSVASSRFRSRGPTQNSLTFNTDSSLGTDFVCQRDFWPKKCRQQKLLLLLLLCYCCCYWASLCGASCCSLFASLGWAAAAADLAAFCCWCCNHVKCQFAFCAIRATLHKQQQQHLRQQPMLQLQPCFQFVTGLKYFY